MMPPLGLAVAVPLPMKNAGRCRRSGSPSARPTSSQPRWRSWRHPVRRRVAASARSRPAGPGRGRRLLPLGRPDARFAPIARTAPVAASARAGAATGATALGAATGASLDGATVFGRWRGEDGPGEVGGRRGRRRGAAEAGVVVAARLRACCQTDRRGAPLLVGRFGDVLEAAASPAEPVEPVLSANAVGSTPITEPTPSRTASAPTRPTYRYAEIDFSDAGHSRPHDQTSRSRHQPAGIILLVSRCR